MVEWGRQRYVIEVKLRRDTETESEQVARYLDHAGLDAGWLVMFDLLRKEQAWADKLFLRTEEHRGKTIRVVGC